MAAGALDITASSGGDLHLRLGSERDGTDAAADVRLGGSDRGRHTFRLDPDGGGLRYENGGAGTATMRATVTGAAGTVTLPAVAVPAGARVQAGRGAVQVRDARGRLVAQRSLQPRTRERVAGLRLSVARRTGNRRLATVRVRYGNVPRDAHVVVAVHAHRGDRRVAAESLEVPARRATGTRTYRFPLSPLKGRYTLRASVGVVSASGTARATVRRALRAR